MDSYKDKMVIFTRYNFKSPCERMKSQEMIAQEPIQFLLLLPNSNLN